MSGASFAGYEVGANGEKEELSDYNVSAVKDEENQIYAVLGGSSESRVSMKTEKKPLRPSY